MCLTAGSLQGSRDSEQFQSLVGVPQNVAEPRKKTDKRKKTSGAISNGQVVPALPDDAATRSRTAPMIRPAAIRTSATTRRSTRVFFRLLTRPTYFRHWTRPEAMNKTSEEE